MKACVIGLGYIGLPTALLIAEQGYQVTGFDIDAQRVNLINSGKQVFQEPQAREKLSSVINKGNFSATTTITSADIFIIAVPTPHINGSADLSSVWKAVDSLCLVIKSGNLIILESTVPVGTTQKIAQYIEKKTGLNVGTEIFVAYSPERVLPGRIFHELVHNARIVGGVDELSTNKAAQLYKKFVKGVIHTTTASTAELVKLIENSSRDVAIAFAHQVAAIAESINLDPYEVIRLANQHPRVSILQPTCGVGGHCIAVDPWFLIEAFPEHTTLLHTAREINNKRPEQVLSIIKAKINSWRSVNKRTPILLTLGLTYKPNVDDIRESPALIITRELATWKNSDLFVCDPYITKEKLEEPVASRLVSINSVKEKKIIPDIVILLVGHDCFALLVDSFESKAVLDFCGILQEYNKKLLSMCSVSQAAQQTSGALV